MSQETETYKWSPENSPGVARKRGKVYPFMTMEVGEAFRVAKGAGTARTCASVLGKYTERRFRVSNLPDKSVEIIRIQ